MRLGPVLIAACVLCSLPASRFAAGQESGQPRTTARLSPEMLDRSLALGRQYLLNAQRPDGRLVYEFDAARGLALGSRNAVREMGGVWAVAIFHRQDPTPETAAAFAKAMKLHDSMAKHTPAGGRYLCEPGARLGATNTMALYVLALQDFLAADQELDAAVRAKYQKDLAASVAFLVSLRTSSGRFHSGYQCADGRGAGSPESYSDGEVLLALVRAAKEAGDAALRDVVLESAAVMYGEYVRVALRADPDNAETKGFYQWGSMAFYELYTAGWPNTQPYAARTIAMARWMIDVHMVLDKGRNTGYAYEGLAVAWELARLTGDRKSQDHIAATIDKGLYKLLTWQIGSPLAGSAVPRTFLKSEQARGGILTEAGEPRLRIDTVQHQMHATLMVRWLLFRSADDGDADGPGATEAAADGR